MFNDEGALPRVKISICWGAKRLVLKIIESGG
jgi:hypothetical protein